MAEFKFFDTNIVYYAKFDNDREKQRIAQKLINETVEKHFAFISVQVLNEFVNNAIKKSNMMLPNIMPVVDKLIESFNVIELSSELTQDALRIASRYGFSFWDSLIIATALYVQCDTLYTEDLQNGQIIDETLTIINPFM